MRITDNSARATITLGSILALIGYIVDILNMNFEPDKQGNVNYQQLIGPIVGITCSVLIFIALGLFHLKKINIPLNAWVMLIFVILQVVLSGAALFSLVGIGVILEIIGTVILFQLEG